ncbi:MAG: CoA transferase [Acidimicrobiia bacterium]|nr:MAG: CoA transferase [Acidimicrobiia bacterium]
MSGPLDGMRVLDAGIWRPLPHATRLLADLGARVTSLEPPGGDPMRAFRDLFADLAHGKEHVEVDLRTGAGRARVLELAAGADVFTEGWRPGVAARLGLAYDDLRAVNPAIVYCSVSGYGQTGPLATRPGHDVVYQAHAGALWPRPGDPPQPRIPRVPVADLATATMAAFVVTAAWARRVRTGEGAYIDLAMADVVASWVGPHDATAVAGRDEPLSGAAGYGLFRCADDRHVAIAVIAEDHLWRAVCDALGLDGLRDLAFADRNARVDECNAAVARAVRALPAADALGRLVAAGAPAAPVLAPSEMAREPHFRERGVVVERDGAPGVGFPARFGGPQHRG